MEPEAESPLEALGFLKVHQDMTRQNIGCLLITLNSAVKSGAEFAPVLDYTISDPDDRIRIQHKIMQLIEKL